jgi:hypothetical protein
VKAFEMHLERLSKSESRVVGEVLRAAADGPFFPDWEFHSLFGLEREEVRRIADDWPLPTAPPDDVVVAVNNSMNMMLSYPHRKHDMWEDWISVDQHAVNELFNRLRGHRNESHFDRMM